MAMSYRQIEVSRELVRDELFSYLRENQQNFVLSRPPERVGANHIWAEITGEAGLTVNNAVNEIFNLILSTGRAIVTNVPINDSTVMNAYEAYYLLQIRIIILEEIFELVRIGVLINAKFKRQDIRNFEFGFDLNADTLILTEYGVQFISQEICVPYFVEKYLGRLREIAELDEELQGYLSEGLICLRQNLSRASAVLLRVAAEHTLTSLIVSMQASMPEKEAQKFKGQVRKAGTNIEIRAEEAFKKLESSPKLLPNKYSKNMVSNRLRAAFHSIRNLGSEAAHLSSNISLEEVREHYTLYAGSVFAITMEIIDYQKPYVPVPTLLTEEVPVAAKR